MLEKQTGVVWPCLKANVLWMAEQKKHLSSLLPAASQCLRAQFPQTSVSLACLCGPDAINCTNDDGANSGGVLHCTHSDRNTDQSCHMNNEWRSREGETSDASLLSLVFIPAPAATEVVVGLRGFRKITKLSDTSTARRRCSALCLKAYWSLNYNVTKKMI